MAGTAELPDTGAPRAPLRAAVLGAQGLAGLDAAGGAGGGSGGGRVLCTCHVRQRPGSQAATRAVSMSQEPEWGDAAELHDFAPEEDLDFHVYILWPNEFEGDEPQQELHSLASWKIGPSNFEGELPLHPPNAGDGGAAVNALGLLRVAITVPDWAVHGRNTPVVDSPAGRAAGGDGVAAEEDGPGRERLVAARYGDLDRLRPLLLAGAGQGQQLEAATLEAARGGHAPCCAALLDARADPICREQHEEMFGDGIWPDERQPGSVGRGRRPQLPGSLTGRTVVYHLRATGSFQEVLRLVFPMTRLLLVRAIAEALQAIHGKPTLVHGASNGQVELTALLLAHDGSWAGPVGGAIGAAASPEAEELAQWIPRESPGAAGASASASAGFASDRGQALLAACAQREWRCARVLAAAGVPLVDLERVRDGSGRTALHLAAAAGAASTARMLLAAGASARAWSEVTGRSPLYDACFSGHLEVATALVGARADPSAPSPAVRGQEPGKSPLEVAKARGHARLAAALQGHDAAA